MHDRAIAYRAVQDYDVLHRRVASHLLLRPGQDCHARVSVLGYRLDSLLENGFVVAEEAREFWFGSDEEQWRFHSKVLIGAQAVNRHSL